MLVMSTFPKGNMKKHWKVIKKHCLIHLNLRKKFFLNLLPTFILGPFLRIISILSASGINLSYLGLPKYSYGTAVICNYGKEGLEDTFLPLFPFSYSPLFSNFLVSSSRLCNCSISLFTTIAPVVFSALVHLLKSFGGVTSTLHVSFLLSLIVFWTINI